MVPPGTPHTFANVSDEPAVLLNTFTPDLYIQYFRDLHDMIASPGRTAHRLGRRRHGRSPAVAGLRIVMEIWMTARAC